MPIVLHMELEAISSLNQIFQSLKIKAECIKYKVCRNFGVYDVRPLSGGKVREIERSLVEIGLALKSLAPLMVKPILAEGVVRIQSVLEEPIPVNFIERFTSLPRPEGVLPFYLGDTSDNNPVWVDFHYNPHLLIAGSSGSGKSTLLHTIVANVFASDMLRAILIDTKNVEFAAYQDIQLVDGSTLPILTTYEEVLSSMCDLYTQMEETYLMMQVENLPANYFALPECKYDKTIVIIDEFADLIMQDKDDRLQNIICKIAQKGRAAGIHFVIATQRPTVNVISGLIKANFPARISCRVASKVDSNVVLDSPLAFGLLGKGDALLKDAKNDMLRFQSAYTSSSEILDNFESIQGAA